MSERFPALRDLLVSPRIGVSDYMTPTGKVPLAPYGQHADPVAALVNFQSDLEEALKELDLLRGFARTIAAKYGDRP